MKRLENVVQRNNPVASTLGKQPLGINWLDTKPYRI
jgi:hypothetical protein